MSWGILVRFALEPCQRVGGPLSVAGRGRVEGERWTVAGATPPLVLAPACRPEEKCTGYEDWACCFCPSRSGAAARVHPTRGESKCMFCCGVQMQNMHEAGWSNGLTAALERFCAASPGVYFAALDRVRHFLGQEAAKAYAERSPL